MQVLFPYISVFVFPIFSIILRVNAENVTDGGGMRCYVCNSVKDSRCSTTAKIKEALDLRKPCETFQDFMNLRNWTHNITASHKYSFTTSPPWYSGNEDDYETVCKKYVVKLTSRDPPGTLINRRKSTMDTRPALPLRHVRYCGIRRKGTKSQNECDMSMGSAKMDISICKCRGDLCNGTSSRWILKNWYYLLCLNLIVSLILF